MLAKCLSGTVCGVEARTVEIEVCSSSGSPQFTIVGLPDQAVKEAKDRVTTALANSGYKRNAANVTVNLAPADVRKEGPLYDLPIAICLLAATGQIHVRDLASYAIAGELALSGAVRRVQGILPIALEVRRRGMHGLIVPTENASEASVVEGLDVIPVRTLREAAEFLSGLVEIEPKSADLHALVAAARERQAARFAGLKGVHCNADMRARDIADYCRLDAAGQERMRGLIQALDLSARAYDRVLKVARTIADLAGSEDVKDEHVFEASRWRELDRTYWN